MAQNTKNNLKLFFQGFRQGFLNFSRLITGLVNCVLLSLAYFVGVGLAAVFAKLLKKHFLETNFSEKDKTYWSDLDLKTRDIKEHYRQF